MGSVKATVRRTCHSMRYARVCAYALFGATVLVGCASSAKQTYQRLEFAPGIPVINQVNRSIQDAPSWFAPIVGRADRVMKQYDDSGRGAIGPYLEADIYLYDDAELNAYLNKILANLTSGLDFNLPNIAIVVESNPRFSAYIDELLQIHLSTGLLRSLSNEDQVAGVIAHELGHLVLRHNLEKKTTSNISSAIEFASNISTQLNSNYRARKSLDIDAGDTRKALDSLDTIALLWTDLLEPSWSRDNEREADYFAMDLMKTSGYNHEQLITAISKIHDANAVRSNRLNRLNKISSELIEQRRKASFNGKEKSYEKYLGDTGARLVSTLADQGLSFLAEKGETHDVKSERIETLKNYINSTYNAYDLPPDIRDEEFIRIVNGGRNAEHLKKDLAAVEAIIAISKRNLSVARDRLSIINANEDGSSQMAAVMAQTAVDVANRKFDSALNALAELSDNPNAPAEVFIKLAKLHAAKRDYAEAERVLHEGSRRIGRSYRFLPTLIKLYRTQRQSELAEKATMECAQYDNDKVLQFVSLVSEITLDSANSFYRHCADILGYDVRARRNKEKLERLEGLHEQGLRAFEKWVN